MNNNSNGHALINSGLAQGSELDLNEFQAALHFLQLYLFNSNPVIFHVKTSRLYYMPEYDCEKNKGQKIIYLPKYLAANRFQTLAHFVYCLSFYYASGNNQLLGRFLIQFGIQAYNQITGICFTHRFYKANPDSSILKLSESI